MEPRKPVLLATLLALVCDPDLPMMLQAAAAAVASPQPSEEAPSRLALLVGIDRYAANHGSGVPPLAGAVRDVRSARELLVKRLGFEAEDVLVLEDEDATHGAIVRAFDQHLIERAGPETEVVFWFSGHGSRVPDQSGEAGVERGGLDSSFVAHDSRSGELAGGHDLVDDELGSLLVALTARTPRVLVILDTCHAGGGVRGARARARLVPTGSEPLDPQALESFWPADVPLTEDRSWSALDPSRFACIAASQPDEVAYEVVVGDGSGSEVHGLMSYFLLDELAHAMPGTTLRAVAERTRRGVEAQRADQTLWTAGTLDRQLLSGRFLPPPPGFEAHPALAGELRVEAGRFQLLRKGSVLTVVDGSGEELGRAEVLDAQATQSRARWIGSAPELEAEVTLRAVETGRPRASEPLSVFTEQADLEALVAASELATPAATPEGSYTLSWSACSGLELHDPEGIRADDEKTDSSGARNVEAVLRRELRWREVFDLGLERGELKLGLSVRPPTPEECKRWGLDPIRFAPLDPGGDQGSATQRALLAPDAYHLFMLEIENRADQPVHVCVVDVSEDRSTKTLCKTEQPLEPGQRWSRPASLLLKSQWPLSRPMRDRLLAVATNRPVDFSALEGETTLRSAREAPAIFDLLQTRPTRGSGSRAEAWGVTCLDLLLEPAPPVDTESDDPR